MKSSAFLVFTATVCALFSTSVFAQEEDQWIPEKLYGPMMAEEEENEPGSVADDIAEWATQPPVGPEGRPLPLAGSWMKDGMYGPERFVEMIEEGHHVFPTFTGMNQRIWRAYLHDDEDARQQLENDFEDNYKPALEYAREHNLPIAFRGWNWNTYPVDYQDLKVDIRDIEISPEENLRLLSDGQPVENATPCPFGPIEGWRELGAVWFGNKLMRMIQDFYPDPPKIVFLNNNEGPKVRNADEVEDGYTRLIEFLGGEKPENEREKERAIRAGYEERYAAMFEGARGAMNDVWSENSTFVAYNNLWDTGYIGQGDRPNPGIWFERDEGWLQWKMFDGGMPELYDNDWQPGKHDYHPWSPQTEAMNYYSTHDWIFEQDPEYYWSTICWEGGRVNDVWRGRRSSSKPYLYITRGQRWDFARYEGWVQFTLWTTRPRSYREFRWPPSEEHAYDEGAFMAVVRSVDRPWEDETLREFWQHGDLAPNPAEEHWFELSDDQPDWIRQLERWYLLTCDANPPREEWESDTKLKVFAQALVLGEEPERRWLIYAHAPRGAVAQPTVTVPGYGDVTLSSVPKSGSFFLLDEQDGEVEPLIEGGPAELSLETDQQYIAAGETVEFAAAVAHAPSTEFERFSMDFGDGGSEGMNEPGELSHTYEAPGTYVVTFLAHRPHAEPLTEQVAVHVGEKPDNAVAYDLPLNGVFTWEGPWDNSGEPEHELVTYSHVPNRGSLPDPVVVGGAFVEDEERGTVLEFEGDAHDGIYMIRNSDTVMDEQGFRNQTISVRFKTAEAEGRQVIYAQGFQHNGFNIYIDGGTLYAGSWSPEDSMDHEGWYPIWGRDFEGHWLSTEVEAERWHEVTFELSDAGEEVEDDRQHLYLDGELADSGPGVRIPRQYGPPRLGRTELSGNLLTRFHDGEEGDATGFSGRLSEFRMTNGQ